jgi:hypothetical protein
MLQRQAVSGSPVIISGYATILAARYQHHLLANAPLGCCPLAVLWDGQILANPHAATLNRAWLPWVINQMKLTVNDSWTLLVQWKKIYIQPL